MNILNIPENKCYIRIDELKAGEVFKLLGEDGVYMKTTYGEIDLTNGEEPCLDEDDFVEVLVGNFVITDFFSSKEKYENYLKNK